MPLDKPSARICHGLKSTPQTPRPPKPQSQMCEHKSEKKCDHWYREFRVEGTNGKVSRVFFYCQKCLDIQIKNID
ncbi:hypothetical protein H839_15993 [Parageobacillus genomosp. 1]|uniref:Uncharacterized protein n=1 Tax=Parageobacillus genomosp. 1 TaxID=1295642 RepID=A0ABC9VA95_9BACL|nr:hypothetical protein H839_15993 [Parageobacillus genomosp. 1]